MGSSEPSDRRAEDGPLVRAFLERREALVLFLAARTRSMATAEDLAQDLFLKISGLEAGGGDGAPGAGGADVRSPVALLYRMAANVLIDHVRSSQRASRRDGQWRMDTRAILAGEEVAGEAAADEMLIAKERVRQLAQAVAELPPQMGRAFRLHKLEGMSQAETAQAMGVSRKMIEQHIAAAVKRLSERLRG